jgi:NADPH-dependent 2,4-dienoyl-CoA reductase/sulfur reductase-like enzyme
MTSTHGFVIIGAALAGASAAKTLRDEGYAGRILLIGSEAHHPYIRPPLSKEFLKGDAERESVFVEATEWYDEHTVELRPGVSATALDAAEHSVQLDGGETVEYDRLLLTTGSSPRKLAIAGAEFSGVHYLRTLDDSEALRTLLADGGKRVVVIGSGWIGMEVAATARTLGNDVTVLLRDTIPLASALGDELGAVFAQLHRDNGVTLRTSTTVDSIVGSDGEATGVRLSDGEVVAADLVVVGIGATPNVALAESAGLDVDNGILVDASLQTSDPDIFAAGDVANAYHPFAQMRLRSEHWANALNGGPVAARSMLGQSVSFDDIPYFYTDQFDLGMEYSGFGPLARGAEVVYRGDLAAREFISFWLADGRVVAGMNVNVWDVNEMVQGLIRGRHRVDVAQLQDAAVPLDSL